MQSELGVKDGDIIFIIGDTEKIAQTALGALRCEIARREHLANSGDYQPVWITDFPMFEFDKEDQRYYSLQHPFTQPKTDDLDELKKAPESIPSRQYDLVINGYEVAGVRSESTIQNYNALFLKYLVSIRKKHRIDLGFLLMH
ncbi:MAG: hypothetical protein Ct9H300mP29_8360 [Candidatus Neomarinimicrobiota bacterium]|nr:MAG: hypothetical protein Ct9H300mP29_8360 [Candidatus Neomarinimicrobiota bacterium]